RGARLGRLVSATAFDALAAGYDAEFSHSPLGRLLRPRVWRRLAGYFGPGDHLLELACGTGEDGLWLARRGVRVSATDSSAGMLAQARAKAQAAGLDERIRLRQLSLQEAAAGGLAGAEAPFDGALSNFGGLNTLGEWRPLAAALAAVVRPGGVAVLVPMGPICPWEIAWNLGHLRPRAALRRWRRPATARIGAAEIPVWYPAAGRLRRDFGPWFRHLSTESLGLWLPPTHLAGPVVRRPALLALLDWLDRACGRLAAGWGDHYILALERRPDETRP
ncbi:MAG: class I SAM-dependent methyltransferase, partial [Candidatus Promineifilaceae bacterium]